jgi:hypothetical protein
MGCGSSSLKGDAPADVGSAPQPVTYVRSNFKDVDYTSSAEAGRSSVPGERAPHEVDPPKPQTPQKEEGTAATAKKVEDNKLEPYKSIADADQQPPVGTSEETPDVIR